MLLTESTIVPVVSLRAAYAMKACGWQRRASTNEMPTNITAQAKAKQPSCAWALKSNPTETLMMMAIGQNSVMIDQSVWVTPMDVSEMRWASAPAKLLLK